MLHGRPRHHCFQSRKQLRIASDFNRHVTNIFYPYITVWQKIAKPADFSVRPDGISYCASYGHSLLQFRWNNARRKFHIVLISGICNFENFHFRFFRAWPKDAELNSRGTPWEQFLDTASLSTAKPVLVPFGKKLPNGNVTVKRYTMAPGKSRNPMATLFIGKLRTVLHQNLTTSHNFWI